MQYVAIMMSARVGTTDSIDAPEQRHANSENPKKPKHGR